MVFQVRLARIAEREIETSYEWLNQRNPQQADRWFRGLMNKLATLQNPPHRCALAVENSSFPEEIRQLLYGKRPHIYRVLFIIRSETVYVVHVRHSKQAPLLDKDWD
ncbi:MAG: type II toxin-antitoxin system RelE/ParE family toxin [Phormidium sp. GEM2.Bin31]|nr:MAG: type II toxin-antitoxin system RelE/ParE family toxin [Phormidium sp. GEM2.Bin31]